MGSGSDDLGDELADLDGNPFDADMAALRGSLAPEICSRDDPTGIDLATFDLRGSDHDLRYAQAMLSERGIIPAADLAGHRGALQMWRNHCSTRREATVAELAADLDQVLTAPRPVPPTCGTYTEPFYAWIRPERIPVTTHSNFPYHYSPAELARVAHNLLTEAGDPEGLEDILGFDLVLVTTSTPHGLVHRVTTNGNHRAAAIRAAGFPVALAQITLQQAPWKIPRFSYAERLYRLLYRSGVISDYRRGDDDDYLQDLVEADGLAPWLLDVENPGDARANFHAYEQAFGTIEDPRLDWIRRRRTFRRMLRREAMTVTEHGPDLLPGLAGRWPPRPTAAQRVEYWLLDRWQEKRVRG